MASFKTGNLEIWKSENMKLGRSWKTGSSAGGAGGVDGVDGKGGWVGYLS